MFTAVTQNQWWPKIMAHHQIFQHDDKSHGDREYVIFLQR